MPDHPMMNPPRELTPQEAEDRAKAMFALHRQIVQDITDGRAALWGLAEHLAEFCDEAGWAALGYDKIGEWLADPEINLTRRTVDRLRRTWTEMALRKVPRIQLLAVDVSKVDIVLPAVKAHRVKLDDALDDASELGARDLRIKYLGEHDPTGDLVTDGNGEPTDPVDDAMAADAIPDGWTPTAKPAPNTDSHNFGHLSSEEEPDWEERHLAFSVRVWRHYAPAPRKVFSSEDRNELHAILEHYGLLDA